MNVLETPRPLLRELTIADATFIHGLLNEPSYLANIGDRGVRTIEQAERFIEERFVASYRAHGYGHWLVSSRSGTPMGCCGLIKREAIGEIDVGYVFRPAFWKQGFAFEAASAVMEWGRAKGLTRIVAVVSPGNHASIRVLEKLGLRYERLVQLAEDAEWIHLYS